MPESGDGRAGHPLATILAAAGHPLATILAASNLLGPPAGADPAYGPEARDLIEGARVLVTGAGGSIGSELVRQLRALHAATVVCVDRAEYGLYRLELDATGRALLDGAALVLADVTSRPQLDRVFAEHRRQLVFHAAAVKHLPLLERFPAEAIRVNVGGTATVARLCAEHRVWRLVNISTNKAADPASSSAGPSGWPRSPRSAAAGTPGSPPSGSGTSLTPAGPGRDLQCEPQHGQASTSQAERRGPD